MCDTVTDEMIDNENWEREAKRDLERRAHEYSTVAARTARASGSPIAKRSDSVGTSGSQLASVLRSGAERLRCQHWWKEDYLGADFIRYRCIHCGKTETCWH